MRKIFFGFGPSAAAICLATTPFMSIAQDVKNDTVPYPALVSVIDRNDFDVTSGRFRVPDLEVSIGQSASGLSRFVPSALRASNFQGVDNWSGPLTYRAVVLDPAEPTLGYALIAKISLEGKVYDVKLGTSKYGVIFVDLANKITASPKLSAPSGAYLAYGGGNTSIGSMTCTGSYLDWYQSGTCTLTTAEGTIADYSISPCTITAYRACGLFENAGRLKKITRKNGEIIDFEYSLAPDGNTNLLQTVSSSLSWMLKYEYNGYSISKISSLNTGTTYCAASAITCSSPANMPSAEAVTMSAAEVASIDATPGYYGYRYYKNGVLYATYLRKAVVTTTGNTSNTSFSSIVKNPSGATYNSNCDKDLQSNYTTTLSFANARPGVYGYNGGGTAICTATRGGSTWTYNVTGVYNSTDSFRPVRTYTKVTTPSGGVSEYYSSSYGLESYKNEVNALSTYTYQNSYGAVTDYSYGLIQSVKYQEGNKVTYEYTGKNISKVNSISKTGVVTTRSYTYDASFGGGYQRPTAILDARNNQTDYTYDATHSGILTQTGPADASGVRPQTRYSYTQLYPKVLNASSVLVNSTPVWRLTKTSSCRTATAANPASCVGTDQETVTEYEYANNNLLLTKTTVRAGNANVSAAYSATNLWQSTSQAYDDIGNVVSVDGPLPGTVDQTFTTYDVLRRPVLEIGADPDDTGALKRKIIRHKYDVDGREYETDNGTCETVGFSNGIPQTCSNFVIASYVYRTYDPTTGLEVKSAIMQP